MVLAAPVGRPRSYWVALLLVVATVGIYAFYWHYKTHMELYEQYELRREGRDDGVVWYILGFVLPPLRFVYYYTFVGNVEYLRQRFGYRKQLAPGSFLGLVIPAIAVFFVGSIVALIMIGLAYDLDDGGTPEAEDDVVRLARPGLLAAGVTVLVLATASYAILAGIAYHRLQSDVNDLWAAYHHRADQLRAAAAPGPGSAPPTGGPGGAPMAR